MGAKASGPPRDNRGMGSRWSAALWLVAANIAACATSPPIILISVDTLRADYLSCYGSRGRPTKNIDRLAQGGTLFANVTAQAPLTLPSHVSMLTSTYPFSNGIQDNGQIVGAGALTLAETLKTRGYRTGAFVGGFVLDRRFGLDQGFDSYDSPFRPPAEREADPTDLKRLGEEVVGSALQWLEKNSSAPFFLFLHLFDLHTPDNLPPAVRARFPGPRYEAELAYVDEVLGKFFQFLQRKGLYETSLIAFTSDHGEGLGDHGEKSHGFFVYQSTVWVPLIIRWPAGFGPNTARFEEPISLLRLAPTLLEAAGIPRPPQFQGGSLIGVLEGKTKAPPEDVVSESLYGHYHFGTSGLWTLRHGHHKYIQAPRPELYDLSADPGERKNLYAVEKRLAQSYQERVRGIRSRYGASGTTPASGLSPEVVARLRSLGYIAGSGGSRSAAEAGADPKDRISYYESYRRAITLAAAGRLQESNVLLESILAKAPELLEVRNLLGMNQQKLGNHEQAVAAFREILAKEPANALAHFNLAISHTRLKQVDSAVRELEATMVSASAAGRALEQVTIPAREMLARLFIEKKEYAQARAQYEQLLLADSGNYEAHYNLAWLDARENRLEEGIFHLRAALQAKPNSAEARNALGGLYLRSGDRQRARAEFEETIRLNPQSPWGYYNLGLVFLRNGMKEDAAAQLRKALGVEPDFSPAREALGRLEK